MNILILGAGRSSSSLIRYLLENSNELNYKIRLVDQNLALAQNKIQNHVNGEAVSFDALNTSERMPHLEWSDIVVSMLPARFHIEIAKDCVQLKKNLITPSYVNSEMLALKEDAVKNGIIILNELGVDPGIDHMSAIKIIHEIKAKGGNLTRFESFTGGLIAPQSDNNPWNYKFTWNPRNVVLAGQGSAARFIQNSKFKFVPYHRLFSRTKEIEIEGYGLFEGYANRDSLTYLQAYGIEDIPTIYRGTLRRKGYPEAWNVFVQLGITDDSYHLPNTSEMTYREFINSFLTYHETKSVEEKIKNDYNISDEVMDKISWLGLFENETIGTPDLTPAQVLQKKLEEKWNLEEDDIDLIVMWHKFEFELEGVKKEITSSLSVEGEDQTYTGMSNTVGLPLAIAVKLVLQGKIKTPGVHLPVTAEIYEPILKELESYNIIFNEKEKDLN